MDRRRFVTAAAIIAVAGPAHAAELARATAKGSGMTAHGFTFEAIDGGPLPLAQFKGKPVLVVNTASFCGFTPQYAGLEKLWQSYKDKGLTVIGVPSNDFGQQEPGTAQEIKTFCETYDVSFPLAEKQVVVGANAHPFWRWVVAELGEAGAPRWNFHKYLIDGEGKLAGAWPSRVTPDSREIRSAVEAALPH